MTPAIPDTPTAPDDMDSSPRSIVRWESAAGLEHTCYACTTKMNNPKAKQTCYGIHSIPCFRYHQTMHAIGTSHNCCACIQADNLHEGRHRKIAELVNDYKELELEDLTFNVKNKKAMSLPLRERDPNTPMAAVPRNRQRLNAPAPLVIPVDDDDDDDDDDQDADENPDDFPDTPSITGPSTTSSTTSKMTKAEVRNAKRAAKSAKAQQKSLKTQTKLATLVSVKHSDVEHVGLILHGSEDEGGAEASARHPLASDKSVEEVIERNRRYVSNIREHKAALLQEVGGRHKQERRERTKRQQDSKMGRSRKASHDGRDDAQHGEDGEEPAGQTDDMLIDAILLKLGITPPPSPSTAAADHLPPRTPNKRHSTSSASGGSSSHGHGKQTVLAQLRVAIADDLEKDYNEQRQTYIRAGGFWRYVGKQIFDRMCSISERIDWRTGAIKHQQSQNSNEDENANNDDDDDGAGAVEEGANGTEDGDGDQDNAVDGIVGGVAGLDVSGTDANTDANVGVRNDDGGTPQVGDAEAEAAEPGDPAGVWAGRRDNREPNGRGGYFLE